LLLHAKSGGMKLKKNWKRSLGWRGKKSETRH